MRSQPMSASACKSLFMYAAEHSGAGLVTCCRLYSIIKAHASYCRAFVIHAEAEVALSVPGWLEHYHFCSATFAEP